jgi:selenophosphate synthase
MLPRRARLHRHHRLRSHRPRQRDGRGERCHHRVQVRPCSRSRWREAVERGFLTGGGKNTQRFLTPRISIAPSVDATTTALLFDAQTSGGLLIAVPPAHAAPLIAQLKLNHPQAAIVGECVPRRDVTIVVD